MPPDTALDVAVNVPYRTIDDAELVDGLAELLDSTTSSRGD